MKVVLLQRRGFSRPSVTQSTYECPYSRGRHGSCFVYSSMHFRLSSTFRPSLLLSFILVMVYSEVQREIQQQLDDILGMQRLPTSANHRKLSFIDCVVSECLRWNPVLPLGLVHLVSEDDEYRGYLIPSVWSISGLALQVADAIQGNTPQ